MTKTSKVGVFDSGIGGLSVVKAIEAAMPEYEVVFVNDTKNVPYGTKSPEELKKLVEPKLQELIDAGCQAIVVACNTVSTTLIEDLRQTSSVPLIAMEPMVKPAAEVTKSGTIAVCATPTTLASKRYSWLKNEFAKGITVVEPDCSDWTSMIESNQLDHQRIKDEIEAAIAKNADVIVLGCTHYHWIEDEIKLIANGRAQVIQPEKAVISQLQRVLQQPA
jgi:glutamate racemase